MALVHMNEPAHLIPVASSADSSCILLVLAEERCCIHNSSMIISWPGSNMQNMR